MSAELITLHDLAALESFISSADRVRATFAAVYKAIERDLKPFTPIQRVNIHQFIPQLADSQARDWVYLAQPKNASWFIQWGICFRSSPSAWDDLGEEINLPTRAFAYVEVAEENDGTLPLNENVELPKAWTALRSSDKGVRQLITTRALSEFPAAAETFTSSLGEWVSASLRDIQSTLIDSLSAAAKR
jgi:hypothetical protein